MSIILSEKYGVNPSIEVCFFCGEEKGIALMGKLKGDVEAPRQCVLNYEPCDHCKELMSQGLALVEVVEEQPDDNRPPIQDNENGTLYPTGRFLVINPKAFTEMTGNEHNFSQGDKCFIDTAIYNHLSGGAENE